VADIEEALLAGDAERQVDGGRQVVVTDLVPREVPEGRVLRRQGHVRAGVGVPAGVAHPHVVARVRQDVS